MSSATPGSNMPEAELDITTELVRRLLEDQHPDLASLPLAELANGWDNMMFRLGDRLTIRLPRRSQAAELIRHEQRWLPIIGPDLPLPTPIPVRVGTPTGYYPWAWSVLPWLPGSPVGTQPVMAAEEAAVQLGRFLAALHRPAPPDAPTNRFRGGSLAKRDDMTRQRIETLADVVDEDNTVRRWQQYRDQPPWSGPPIWLHGDLHPLNLLQQDDRISAVIDFGDITGGDPATDLAIGFSLFHGSAREVFRQAADSPERPIDDAMWSRAEGWSLSVGLAIMAASADNPIMLRLGRKMVGGH